MITLLGRTLGGSIAIARDAAGQSLPVLIDRSPLEQVIANLAVNARDAMPRGGKLTISTRLVEIDGKAFARLSVIDTGIGMPPEVEAHIFEPFFTTKGPDKGTGLGLATVRGIVTQAGGRIGVTSAAGAGASFQVDFPISDAHAEVAEEIRRAEPIPGGRGERILVVEDDDAVRELARRILASAGYAVVGAGDAEEAIAVATAARGRIDLVLADVILPRMSGVECARRLVDGFGPLRVAYTSGFPGSASTELGDRDRTPFLAKPYAAEDLLRFVRHVLDGEAAPGDSPA